jgi:hypothetical protein
MERDSRFTSESEGGVVVPEFLEVMLDEKIDLGARERRRAHPKLTWSVRVRDKG